jgi:hypothetical protein
VSTFLNFGRSGGGVGEVRKEVADYIKREQEELALLHFIEVIYYTS